MNERLERIRAAAGAEVRDLETNTVLEEPAADSDAIDELLERFLSQAPPSRTWLAVIEDLALQFSALDAHAGLAAEAARRQREGRSVTVEAALKVPPADARRYLQAALGLSTDAADEFLERPAASLATRSPQGVRRLAELARRPIGELFDDIASSWRASGDYVYAYRPGQVAEEPAQTARQRDISALVDWGAALLG